MLKSPLFWACLAYSSICNIVSEADFLYQASTTTAVFPSNYVGIVMNLSQVYTHYNTTNFQGYILNSNLKGLWANNFYLTLRMQKDWYYDCPAVGISATDTTACKFQIKGNVTWLTQLGQFIWNSVAQPNWGFGLNNQKLLFTNSTHRSSIYGLLFRVYFYSRGFYFGSEMMYQGDLAVANGLKTGPTYTFDNFLAQAAYYQPNVFSGPFYRGPGVSEYASVGWYSNISAYFTKIKKGYFTFEPIIFLNPSDATISNLLSDNYTQGYFKRRFKVNESFSYTNFSTMPTAFARVRLVPGNGIDGVTNTFAAAIWWIDFLMQGTLYVLHDIGIEGAAHANNFQSAFGPAPDFTPTVFYYASIMAILAGQLQPKIVIPSVIAGTSDKIKIWGLQSLYVFKVLILNKDENPLVNGTVSIKIASSQNQRMSCIYMRAPNLTSKAENVTLGGHKYIGGNSTPQGNYQFQQHQYDYSIKGYSIPIKYAEVALCEVSNSKIVIQTKQDCWQSSIYYLGIFAIFLIFIEV